jgi:hypothetical protein
LKNFSDIGALRSALQDVYDRFPSEANKRLSDFAGILEAQLDFTKEDAAVYASIVLTRNAAGSSDWAGWNAIKLFGTWMRMSQEGMAAALLKSETETWKFSEDLTCEHKWETYEGYVSSFGSSYSVPSSKRQLFAWASSDLEDQGLKVVIVSLNGGARGLNFVWLDEEIVHRKCSINGETFMKQWAVG